MRLIDADGLSKSIYDNVSAPYEDAVAAKEDCLRAIEEAPTVDAVPVVHGEWLLRHEGCGHYWECSSCHKNPCIYVTKDTRYCPNCGAMMDSESDTQN